MQPQSAARQRKPPVTDRQVVTIEEFERSLQKLSDSRESVNMLIYGDSNAGKTVLAGSAPGQQFWLVCEPGYKTAVQSGAKGIARRISNAAEALASVDWLTDRNRYERFRTIVLDGLTTMQDRFRLAYAAEAFDTRGSRTGRNLPDKPDYFSTQNFVKAWLPQLIDLPVNLIVTAHAYRTDRTENGELLTFPGIQGKVTEVSNAVSGLMDVTAYYALKQVKNRRTGEASWRRRLYFQSPDSEEVRYICGDKFGKLGKYMDSPTIPKIMALINGEDDNA